MENSSSKITMAHMMLPEHTNSDGNIHGGVIMKFIDDAAAVVAMKHARKTVVTASIDQLDFHRPVFSGNLLVLKAALNLTGNSSMEIGVRVEAEELTKGTVSHIASAYLSFVAIDENRRPTPVPSFEPRDDEEKRRYQEALKRKKLRKNHEQ